MASDSLRIGRFTVELDVASEWVREYTDAETNASSNDPYAYPAYDGYESSSNEPGTLTDGDLLAPVLLNVDIGIRSYYGLKKVRTELESVLAEPRLAENLADLSDEEIAASATGIYEVLDGDMAPSGIGGTKLSKIVHRKRPASLALHDKWVHACYVGPDGPVVPARKGERTWAEYMSQLTIAIATDLRSQRTEFSWLQERSLAESPPLTDLRLLDILAWHRGRSG